MENEIKIGENTFNFKFPDDLEAFKKNPVENVMLDWVRLIEKERKGDKEDVWSEIPYLPGYKFKNLNLVSMPLKIDEELNRASVDITVEYDYFEKTKAD